MKAPVLVSNRLYFGIDPYRLRDASGRVLARVAGAPPDRAVVGLQALAEDFKLPRSESRAIVDRMVSGGLLERLTPSGSEYAITDRFRALAQAHVIEPLPREQAKGVLTAARDAAASFNRNAVANKYEIEAVAVFGSYMSLDDAIPDLSLAITGRRRPPAMRPKAGRATVHVEGRDELEKVFERLSGFVRVHFFKHLNDVPRPFSVIFRDQG